MRRTTRIETLTGCIMSVGFASGHRFVVGCWAESPVGAFTDVMWAPPDNSRVLLAPPQAAEFITSVYPFAEVRRQAVNALLKQRRADVTTGGLRLSLDSGRTVLAFPPRPRLFTATVENRCALAAMGVRTWGVSPTGVTEWYRARSLRWITQATAVLHGERLGPISEVRRPLGFGFTDPPRRPSRVSLRVDLTGRRKPGP